jgi:hypothetical protein
LRHAKRGNRIGQIQPKQSHFENGTSIGKTTAYLLA